MISSQFPPLWGGVGSVVHGQVERLAARGHEVHVIMRPIPEGKSVPPIEGNVTVHHVPMVMLPMAFTTSFARNAVKKIIELGNDFDVVQSHSNMSLLQKRHYWDIASPICSTMHGTWQGERSMITWRDATPSFASINDLAVMYLSPIFDVYEDYALTYSNAAFIECDNEMRAVRARGVHNVHGDDRIMRLSAGIDAQRFNPENADPEVLTRYGADPDAPTVLFVGRLAARKGIFDMIEIFAGAQKIHPSSQLVVLGEGPQESSLRRRIHEIGLADVVHFTGPVPFPDLQAMYATADVVLYPSFWEGQGLVAGEAMASGTPVVAAEMGLMPELIRPGENGFLHPVRNVAIGIDHLDTLLEDPDLRKQLGQQGRKDILDHWEWKHHVNRLEQVYEEVSSDSKPPRDA